MSVSIEVSFEHEAELLAVTERLHDLPLRVSKCYQKPGARFRRVYLLGEAVTGEDSRPGKRPVADKV